MDRLGRRLREARQAKEATLQDAEAATHIRARFLESLEAGDFAAFGGGDVQVRGFLCIYARYLGLCPEDVIRRYISEVQGMDHIPPEATVNERQSPADDPPDDLTSIRFRPRDIPMGSSLPRWMSVRTVVIVGVVLTTLLGVLALATYLTNRPQGRQSLSLPMGLASPQASPDMTALTTSVTATMRLPASASPENTGDEVTLVLEATEQVQVRVRQGSEIVYQEMMTPGQIETWTGNEVIVVETGNGPALTVTVNGAEVGSLCDERGVLCVRAWGPDGEVASGSEPE